MLHQEGKGSHLPAPTISEGSDRAAERVKDGWQQGLFRDLEASGVMNGCASLSGLMTGLVVFL